MHAHLFQERIEKEPSFSCYVIVKVRDGMHGDIIKKMTEILNIALPHKDAVVKSLAAEKAGLYDSERGFRTAMLAGTVVVFLITLMGLLGYTVTESNRRSKELALRKISGARLSDVLLVFIKELEFVAFPAILAGSGGALIASRKWMENFSSRMELNAGIFLGCGLFVVFLIAFISTLNYVIIANKNPVDALRYE